MFGEIFSKDFLYSTLIILPGILIGFSFHEFAHAFFSDKLGDPTPREQGRLTLSPLVHIDIIGFIMIILVHFGWAKPVQINPRYYKNPLRDEIIVSVAGPLTNLAISIIFAMILKIYIGSGFSDFFSPDISLILIEIIKATIAINIILFIFNLLPIPPLDGSHVLLLLLPRKYFKAKMFINKYGILFLLILVLTPLSGFLIFYPADYIIEIIYITFNL